MNNFNKQLDSSHLLNSYNSSSYKQIQKTVPISGTVFLERIVNKNISPFTAVKLARKLIVDHNKEHLFAIYLTPVRKIPKCELISLGTLTASIVHPREIFRPAIKYNSVQVMLLHNHPSGDVLPSNADDKITKQLEKAGRLLGIELLDHVIFDRHGRYYSFRSESNIMFK